MESRCPDETSIDEYLQGQLPRDEQRRIEDHIDRCPGCRWLIAALAPDRAGASGEYRLGDPLVEGTLVEHFQVMRMIGRGAMGEVYLCRDTKLGRRVALKVVRPEVLGSSEATERFLAEARITGHFNHPHIVTIHAANIWRGLPYLALEYLDGETLRQRLDRERLSVIEAVRVGLDIAEALAEAHDHGVLHRDLKPANVLLPQDGRLRVVDFGLSASLLLDREDPALGETPPRTPGGTPSYMSPEQWREGASSRAADVWSLGVLLHELLTGRRPFTGDTLAKLCLQITAEEPVPRLRPAGDFPEGLVNLVAECLSRDPAARPQAAGVSAILARQLELQRRGGAGDATDEQNPFRGLSPFSEQHAGLFFGRGGEIASFLERMRAQAVLPVVGPSGVGKTSFVQAGVIPRLRDQGQWLVLRLRPGAAPFVSLAHALVRQGYGRPGEDATGGTLHHELQLARHLESSPMQLNLALRELARQRRCRVLLFVDQLEEVCTLVTSQQRQARFIEALCGAGDDPDDPVRVVLVLRDDFLGRLVTGLRARESLGHAVLLGCPQPEALEQIVRRPVARRGYRYDPEDLPRRMVRALSGEPSALPLLQFATRTLWDRRDREGRRLLGSVHDEIGGVAGALASHADSILEGLSPAEASLVRQVLLRLVTQEGTRRVVPRSALLRGLPPRAARLTEHLVSGRLLTVRRSPGLSDDTGEDLADEPHLELIHESLMHTWTRLARWIEEDREDLAFIQQVSQAAELWRRRGQRAEEVWSGPGLMEARRALDNLGERVPQLAHRFIEAGLRRARSQTLRRRGLVAAIIALLVVAAGVLAHEGREARRQRDRAEQHRRSGEARRAQVLLEGARSAMHRGDLLQARAQLRGALESGDSTAGRVLWWRLHRMPQTWRKQLAALPYGLAPSPDGKQLAVASQDRSIYLLDSQTLQTLRVLRGHPDQVFSVAFSPDGKRLAAGCWSGAVTLWDLDGPRARRLSGHKKAVTDLRFSPDSALLATASWDYTARLWDGTTGAPRGTLSGHQRAVLSLAFSPDGARLATGSSDTTARTWRLPAGSADKVLKGHGGGVYAVEFFRKGARLVSTGRDSTIRVWDASSGRKLRQLSGHVGHIYSLDVGPGDRLLASSGHDRTIRIWDLRTWQQIRVHRGHAARTTRVRFSPDGRSLYSIGRDKTARRWSPLVRGQHARSTAHRSQVWGVSFSPDDRLLATGGYDHTVRLWDVASGAQRAVFRGHTAEVKAVQFSHDGRHLFSAGRDHSIRKWSVATRAPVKVMAGHGGAVQALDLSPDGATLASTGDDATIRLWDAAQGRQLRVLSGHVWKINSVRFSPDGRRLISASSDRRVGLWDLQTGKMTALTKHTGTVQSAAFESGERLVWAGLDGKVRLVDLPSRGERVIARFGTRAYQLDLHPGGAVVGVPLADGTAGMIDLLGGGVRRLRGHAAEVNVLRFSHDGKLAATTSDDGTVRLWSTKARAPLWHAPLFIGAPPRLITRRGVIDLASGKILQEPRAPRWMAAVRHRARRASATAGQSLLCILTHDGALEIWQPRTDTRLLRRSISDPQQVSAVPAGCLVRAAGVASLISSSGASAELRRGAGAVGSSGDRLLIASGEKVELMRQGGAVEASHRTGAGVSAMALSAGQLAVGFDDGSIELRPATGARVRAAASIQKVPSSPVVRLAWGPARTLIAGFANGVFGIWNLDSGARLFHTRLHGPVLHIISAADRLYVATELGHHLTLDLKLLRLDHCELLRQVWARVPVLWDAGRPALRPPPADHRCASKTDKLQPE